MTYLHILKGELKKLWGNRAFLLLLLLLALVCGCVAARQLVSLLALTQLQTMYAYISRGTGYFVLLMLIYTVLVGLLLYDRYRRFVGVRKMKMQGGSP
ncbi:MAG: hypothetical protein IJW40_06300 [Clostridia bacterium]|nr:hypothetical protein [Clostridia bacterium]